MKDLNGSGVGNHGLSLLGEEGMEDGDEGNTAPMYGLRSQHLPGGLFTLHLEQPFTSLADHQNDTYPPWYSNSASMCWAANEHCTRSTGDSAGHSENHCFSYLLVLISTITLPENSSKEPPKLAPSFLHSFVKYETEREHIFDSLIAPRSVKELIFFFIIGGNQP